MEKTAHPTYAHCPIRHIVDRFGDKWSLLVLYNLHTSGCLRFSEIHRRTADAAEEAELLFAPQPNRLRAMTDASANAAMRFLMIGSSFLLLGGCFMVCPCEHLSA